MTFWQLYLTLRRNRKLSELRSALWEQNQIAQVFTILGVGFMAVYLIALGTMLGWASRGGDNTVIFLFMPFLLLIDFFTRFGMQQTPSMMVKPYLLMPVRKRMIIDCFLVQTLTLGINYVYMFMFVPYTYIAWCGGTSLAMSMATLAVAQLLIILDSQWYLLIRTLINRSLLWWLLPIAVYGVGYGVPLLVYGVEKGMDKIVDACLDYGMHPMTVIAYTAIFAALFAANRALQQRGVDEEVEQEDKVGKRAMSNFTFFERFGEIGEYLKLEIKCAMRCKTIRQRFVSGIVVITMLSLIIAYTDIYDGNFTTNMWCIYCFVFFGATTLIKIMGVEGNYIDFLMVHRENIYTLLRAKYYFYSATLILPMVLLLPAIIAGKFPLLMILAYMLLTIGPCYCLLFLLAIYNRQTLPLNDKITGKNNFENKLQLIIELVVFFVPVAVTIGFTAIFGDTLGYIIIIAVGTAFTVLHTMWLRAIYRRMMDRKYDNMEGFHS